MFRVVKRAHIVQCSNVQFSNVLCSNVQVLNTFREHLFRNFINFSRHQKQHLQKHMVAFTKILSWLRTKKIINADSTIYNDDSIKDSSLESKERFHLMILGQLGFNLLQYDPHLCVQTPSCRITNKMIVMVVCYQQYL